jgi:hypothetical protein
MHVPYSTKSPEEWLHVTLCLRFKITLGNTLVQQATFVFWPIFFELTHSVHVTMTVICLTH